MIYDNDAKNTTLQNARKQRRQANTPKRSSKDTSRGRGPDTEKEREQTATSNTTSAESRSGFWQQM